jgi:hypothetical protein
VLDQFRVDIVVLVSVAGADEQRRQFAADHPNFSRGIDADLDTRFTGPDHTDDNVLTDANHSVALASQNQHDQFPFAVGLGPSLPNILIVAASAGERVKSIAGRVPDSWNQFLICRNTIL